MNSRRVWVVVVAVVSTVALVLPVAAAPPGGTGQPEDPGRPDAPGRSTEVRTAADAAVQRLHPRLREETTSPEQRMVSATVVGDTTPAERWFEASRAVEHGGGGLVVGFVRGTALVKLAATDGVVSVAPVDFERTGAPLGIPDEDLEVEFDPRAMQARIKSLQSAEVSYTDAPEPAGSNFDEILAGEPFADADTHGFHEAWEAGFTGEGVRVGVLDGGTDFGHPDLLGTWAQEEGEWPEAYDPYGTLLWFSDVVGGTTFVEQGLGFYTITTPVALKAPKKKGGGRAPVSDVTHVFINTRTGPARNFSAPSGTTRDRYTLLGSWSQSGTVRVGSHPDDHLLAIYGHRPGVLVTDPNEAGVYDTVYVDLDNDYSFVDEKPITRESPASYRDMNGDSYLDISGGLLYHVSDGATPLPGGPDVFVGDIVGDPGEILAWTGDYDPAIGGHGTLTASNVAGQGVINGLAPEFDDVGRTAGAVIGGAPDADLVPFGDIYFAFETSTQIGYLLANIFGVDITSNSYGDSSVDNDGFDAASQEADIIHSLFGFTSLPIFSTGNGAPGMGTTAPPAPAHGLSTGASTQFGSTGWDSIANASQIVDNDVMVWSNRGPGATGSAGVDIVADGAFSAGDITLNAVGDGQYAWATWGGTSRSTPVAAGAAALVYQALGDTGAPGIADHVKSTLKSSATDLEHSSFVQGAGSLHAGRAVQAALGSGATVTPDEWRTGDYDGQEWEVFPHVLPPGASDTQEFQVTGGAGGWTASDRTLRRTASEDIGDRIQVQPVSAEDEYHFNAPDYLADISDIVEQYPDADHLVIRANYPLEQLDPTGQYRPDNQWRLLTYSWTDLDGDGELWTDADGDGVVDITSLDTSSSIDGFTDIDYDASEIDEGEYVRFMYHRAWANTLQNHLREPAQRLAEADGIFLGLQHPARTPDVPVTDFEIQVDVYENVDWAWMETSVGAGTASATVTVPGDAAPGMYDGAVVLTNAVEEVIVPVTVTVPASPAQDADGAITEAVTFGGVDQSDQLMDNGSVFGASDWSWRAESGDWRFFYLDLPQEPPVGTQLLMDTSWEVDEGGLTDIDTLLFGRASNHYQLFGGTAPFGAPYILDTLAASQNTNVGGGVWTFDTATGGPREIVAGPAGQGLQAVVHHQVLHEGDRFHTPFETTVGAVSVDPASVVQDVAADTGSFDITVSSNIELTGLEVDAFGLSQPVEVPFFPTQDDPNDPSSAGTKYPVTVEHGASLEVETFDTTNDLDLFVVRDSNGDGQFTNDEIIASSTTGSGAEFISISSPPDGDYEIWVQGWSVTDADTEQVLRVDVVQGFDLTVAGAPEGAVAAGEDVVLTVSFDRTADPLAVGETYRGLVLLGPPEAPGAVRVPVELTRVASP